MLRHFRIRNALFLTALALAGLVTVQGLAQDSRGVRFTADEERGQDPTSQVEGQNLIAADPSDPDAYIRYARFLQSSGDLEEAEEILQVGRTKANRSARLLVALAGVQEDRRQLAKAEATVREALAVDPDFVPAHLLMGHLKFRLGMPQHGLRSYRTAHELAPTEPEPQVRLVEGMMANGMVSDAEDQCLKFLAENGTNTDLWLALGKVFEEQEKLREAFTTYGQVMTLDPLSDEASARQGRLFCRFGQFEAAKASCERALEINPDNLIAHAYLGIAASRLGDGETARRHAKIAEAGGLNMASVWEELGK
jgi:tetratricopeptide (TPR) repeat protein